MCLSLTPKSKILVSKQNKIVYKRFYQHTNCLSSPYKGTRYYIGKKQTTRSFGVSYGKDHRGKNVVKKLPKNAYAVYQGIHCFKTLERAENNGFVGNTIVRCRIPAGTPYIHGDDDEIVTLALIPVEVL